MTTEQFTLKCPQCGGTRFKAKSAKPGPDDPLTCAGCGTAVTLGAVKARIEQEAQDAVRERLRDRLVPGVSFEGAPDAPSDGIANRLKRLFGFLSGRGGS